MRGYFSGLAFWLQELIGSPAFAAAGSGWLCSSGCTDPQEDHSKRGGGETIPGIWEAGGMKGISPGSSSLVPSHRSLPLQVPLVPAHHEQDTFQRLFSGGEAGKGDPLVWGAAEWFFCAPACSW